MTDEFIRWFKENERRLQLHHVLVKVKRQEAGRQAPNKAWAGVETKSILASFTIWASGALEIIILSKLTNVETVVDDSQLNTPV